MAEMGWMCKDGAALQEDNLKTRIRFSDVVKEHMQRVGVTVDRWSAVAIPKGGNQKKVINFDLWIVHLFKCFKMIHYFSRMQAELGVWAYGCWVVEREVGNLNTCGEDVWVGCLQHLAGFSVYENLLISSFILKSTLEIWCCLWCEVTAIKCTISVCRTDCGG